MTLPGSGQFSIDQINTELGLGSTAQFDSNSAAFRAMIGAGASGTQIDMNTCHGKSRYTSPYKPLNGVTAFGASVSSNSSGQPLSGTTSSGGFGGPTNFTGHLYIQASASATQYAYQYECKLTYTLGGIWTTVFDITSGAIGSTLYTITLTNIDLSSVNVTTYVYLVGDGTYQSTASTNISNIYIS
jgi:hypothetical protein